MILFLYGQDTYRSHQKLNEIIDQYKRIHQTGLNLKYFDFKKKEISYQDFKDEFKIFPMFKEKKLIVLKNIFSNSESKKGFLKDIKDFKDSEHLILIYEKGEILSNNSFLKKIKKQAKSQEFNYLEGQKLKNWIKKEFENYQLNIEPGVLEKLIDFVGNDLWQIIQEIRKLTAYRINEKDSEIKVNDVEILVRPKIETDIFKTIDFIISDNKKRAFQLLKKHFQKGDSPLYLLSMINFQFRNLLIVKNLIEKQIPYSTILKQSGLHPFVIKKSYSQSQKFTIERLKKIYQKIFQVDIDIKTGRLEPETALDLLVAEI